MRLLHGPVSLSPPPDQTSEKPEAPSTLFNPRGAAAGQDDEEVNTGQDPTKPLTRLDLRFRYQNLPAGNDDGLFTLRLDKALRVG